MSNDYSAELKAKIAAKTSGELIKWREAVQTEICAQCKLRTDTSPYFKPATLEDQTLRERLINDELASRGLDVLYSGYTDPVNRHLRIV